jgi:hypothetical protein
MSETEVEQLLRADEGVQSMAALYAAMDDWYYNIHQVRRGVRACDRLMKIRENGLVPLAQRYFEYVASENDCTFDGDAEALLEQWGDEYRPDYVAEAKAEDHDWDDYGRGLTRALLDAESRIGYVTLDVAIAVNDVTINIYDEDELSESLQDEFADLWREWFRRLDDLYWDRRGRLSKDIVRQMEKGILESEDKTWARRLDRYPQLPSGTIVAGEKVY